MFYLQSVKECVLANAISLWGVVSAVQCCQRTLLNKVLYPPCDLTYSIITFLQEPFGRLNEAYRHPLEEGRLQQVFKQIESPIDFLTALHNFIVVHVSQTSLEECKPKWRYVWARLIFSMTGKFKMRCFCYFGIHYQIKGKVEIGK